MKVYVVYENGWPVGIYDTLEECADVLGICKKTAMWYAQPSAREERPNLRHYIVRVRVEVEQ